MSLDDCNLVRIEQRFAALERLQKGESVTSTKHITSLVLFLYIKSVQDFFHYLFVVGLEESKLESLYSISFLFFI